MEDENRVPETQPTSLKRSSKLKLLFSALLVLVAFAGMAFAGLKWRGQILVYKSNINQRDQQLAKLEEELDELKSKSSKTQTDEVEQLNVPSDKDIVGIDEALTKICNKETTNNVYVTADANGEHVTKVSKEFFAQAGPGDNPKFYNGYAVTGISCREKNDPNEPNGGALAFLKRQPDGSWTEIFAVQDLPLCTDVNMHKIPRQILSKCADNNGNPQDNKN